MPPETLLQDHAREVYTRTSDCICCSCGHVTDSRLSLQVLPIGIVDKPHGSAHPAWLPRYHIRYGQGAMDVPDGLPKWCGAAV